TDAARKRRVADDDSVRSGHIRRVQGMRPGRWNGRSPSLYGIRRAIAAADGQRGKDERANERSTDGHGVSPRRGGRDETAAEASQISALKPTISATGGSPSSFYCEIGEGSAVAVERLHLAAPRDHNRVNARRRQTLFFEVSAIVLSASTVSRSRSGL